MNSRARLDTGVLVAKALVFALWANAPATGCAGLLSWGLGGLEAAVELAARALVAWRRRRASASLRSSLVLKAAQVSVLNLRRSSPRVVVSLSNSLSVSSV